MKNFKIAQWNQESPNHLYVCYLHTDEQNNILYSEGEVDCKEEENANTKIQIMEDAIHNGTVHHYKSYHKDTLASSVLDAEVIAYELRKGWDK